MINLYRIVIYNKHYHRTIYPFYIYKKDLIDVLYKIKFISKKEYIAKTLTGYDYNGQIINRFINNVEINIEITSPMFNVRVITTPNVAITYIKNTIDDIIHNHTVY